MTDQHVSPVSPELAVDAQDLHVSFPLSRNLFGRATRRIHAVDGVSFTLERGQTLGIVGESGSGKTTLGRVVSRLLEPDSGQLSVAGLAVNESKVRALREFRKRLQVIFQDPYGSLDPTKTIFECVTDPLLVHGLMSRSEAQTRAGELLSTVGLDPALGHRYSRQLSGGQRQRVSIARAMALEPEVLIADEPTSALDLSTRAGILNLLLDFQRERGLSIVLISHDMTTIRHMAHSVLVMYLGQIVEEAPTSVLTDAPQHPYTQALLSAVPVADPEEQRSRKRIRLTGELPNAADPPSGCRFRSRCPFAKEKCVSTAPEFLTIGENHRVACHKAANDREYESQPLMREGPDTTD